MDNRIREPMITNPTGRYIYVHDTTIYRYQARIVSCINSPWIVDTDLRHFLKSEGAHSMTSSPLFRGAPKGRLPLGPAQH